MGGHSSCNSFCSDRDNVKLRGEAPTPTCVNLLTEGTEAFECPAQDAEEFSLNVPFGKRYLATVTATAGIRISQVTGAKPFQNWIASISKLRRVEVPRIHLQSVDFFDSEVGFIKFSADAYVKGRKVPGIIFMRGGAVAILVILHSEGCRYTVVVRQPRVPVCHSSIAEIPSGTLDGCGNFTGVGAEEMQQEIGIRIGGRDLFDMTRLASRDDLYDRTYAGMFPLCGGSDEFNRLFVYQKSVSVQELNWFKIRMNGIPEEGKLIKLQIIPLEALWRTSPDAKALSALCLYQKLDAAGLIPNERQYLV